MWFGDIVKIVFSSRHKFTLTWHRNPRSKVRSQKITFLTSFSESDTRLERLTVKLRNNIPMSGNCRRCTLATKLLYKINNELFLRFFFVLQSNMDITAQPPCHVTGNRRKEGWTVIVLNDMVFFKYHGSNKQLKHFHSDQIYLSPLLLHKVDNGWHLLTCSIQNDVIMLHHKWYKLIILDSLISKLYFIIDTLFIQNVCQLGQFNGDKYYIVPMTKIIALLICVLVECDIVTLSTHCLHRDGCDGSLIKLTIKIFTKRYLHGWVCLFFLQVEMLPTHQYTNNGTAFANITPYQ